MVRESEDAVILEQQNPFGNIIDADADADADLIDLSDENVDNKNKGQQPKPLSFFTPPSHPSSTSTSNQRVNLSPSLIPSLAAAASGPAPTSNRKEKEEEAATFLSPKTTMRKISSNNNNGGARREYLDFVKSGTAADDDMAPWYIGREKVPELMQSVALSPLETMRKISQSATPVKPLNTARSVGKTHYGGLVGSQTSSQATSQGLSNQGTPLRNYSVAAAPSSTSTFTRKRMEEHPLTIDDVETSGTLFNEIKEAEKASLERNDNFGGVISFDNIIL